MPKGRWWTTHEVERLKWLAQDHRAIDIAKRLGRSVTGIYKAVERYHVDLPRRFFWSSDDLEKAERWLSIGIPIRVVARQTGRTSTRTIQKLAQRLGMPLWRGDGWQGKRLVIYVSTATYQNLLAYGRRFGLRTGAVAAAVVESVAQDNRISAVVGLTVTVDAVRPRLAARLAPVELSACV